MPATLFSWGYYGWGNATGKLVQLVDAVEGDRGFAPPLFVDTRIRRTVRAKGFQGPAFADLVGASRHVWMRGLGNEAIRTGEGGIRISDPSAAERLLDLALADGRRRVIFFCSCRWPMQAGCVACHRRVVADLILERAADRGEAVEVVEWPGGTPGLATTRVGQDLLAAVRRGRMSVPLGQSLPEPTLRGLPWGSVLAIGSGGEEERILSGPPRFSPAGWELLLLEPLGQASEAETAGRQAALRSALGLVGRTAG